MTNEVKSLLVAAHPVIAFLIMQFFMMRNHKINNKNLTIFIITFVSTFAGWFFFLDWLK